MADGVTLNSGSGGSTLGTDDIGGTHYQLIKLGFGALDTFNIVTDLSTNPFPVALSATDNAVLDTIETNTDFGAVVGGGVEATALRVTIANDSTGVVTVDGTVTANLSATDNAVLDTIETNTDFGTVVGGGVEATALRVTIASDSTGVVTVDGTVTANLSATDNTVLDNIQAAVEIMDDWDETNRCAVNPISGQAGVAGGSGAVGATTQRVTLATDVALPAGTNAIGKLAANTGVDIGDVDVTSISAGSNLIGDVGLSGARTSGGTSFFYDNDLDETDIQVKGSAGQIYWIHCINLHTAPVYLQVFNALAASVTVGTTTPDMQFVVPSQGDVNGAGFTLNIPNGIAMGTGITVACTLTSESATSPGTNVCHINMGYA